MRIIKLAVQDLIDATVVEVEASFTKGMPSFTIVGMVNTSITSKDRVKSALLINNFKFPPLKITINLSPSDLNKKGTHFDLSIALQIALFITPPINNLNYGIMEYGKNRCKKIITKRVV
ncbi:magnesium chelatase domain-containing protein [Aliarcobacter cibarius]|uniref:magnesium chelatase domain-containing protein n=1 Tax=Aliarcobacter cibarius TaxID=255507 RepID=UPI001247A2D5|nr:magnesium chelatase domain-containing protein [Aliarcobacter cibarius]